MFHSRKIGLKTHKSYRISISHSDKSGSPSKYFWALQRAYKILKFLKNKVKFVFGLNFKRFSTFTNHITDSVSESATTKPQAWYEMQNITKTNKIFYSKIFSVEYFYMIHTYRRFPFSGKFQLLAFNCAINYHNF